MPNIIISNTTPIITLLGIGKLDLLKDMYQKVVIPQAVYLEIEAGKDKSFYMDLKQISWIEIKHVQNQALVQHIQIILDKGEAETIALAEELKADIILLDERLARNYAMMRNLIIVGTFGVLLKAKDLGIIGEVKSLLEKAQNNGIRISQKIVEIVLREANEL